MNNGLITLLFFIVFVGVIIISNSVPVILMFLTLSILFICIPIIIHFNYWALDKNLILKIDYRIQIKNEKTDKEVIIEIEDIESIETVESSSSRAIWNMNEYFRIKTKNGGFVTLTNYIVDGGELIELLNLERKRVRKTEFIPIVGDNELGNLDKVLRTT